MNWWLISPELIVAATLLLVLVLDFLFDDTAARNGLGILGLVGVTAALLVTLMLFGENGEMFGGLFVVDTLAVFFKIIFLAAAILVFLMAFNYLDNNVGSHGEFYWLTLTALLGMMVTAASRELVTIYVGIELISLSFYALVGFKKTRVALEAALKYFILGSFAIGIWLYGAALIYGVTGHTDLMGIAAAIGSNSSNSSMVLLIGLFLLIAGFGFKMGLAPFHMWIPDAYQGAPTPITGFLAVGSKAAAFSVFIRVMATGFPSLSEYWTVLLGIIAIITMTWGNTAALRQTNIKRMLAYSGVAHAGYLLVGVVSASTVGYQAVMFYLFGYLFANLGAFAVVVVFANATNSHNIADYAGLSRSNPYLAAVLALCLLSLAGIPPLAGFFGKFYLFWSAVQQGGWLLWLVVIGGINSAISLFYYVNVVRTMYFQPSPREESLPVPGVVNVTLAVALAGVVLALLYFQPVLSGIETAPALISFM